MKTQNKNKSLMKIQSLNQMLKACSRLIKVIHKKILLQVKNQKTPVLITY